MEKNVLNYLARAFALLLFLFVSCAPLNVKKQHPEWLRTYRTILPSGKVFSVTFNDYDSTFKEKNCIGIFRGEHMYEDWGRAFREFESDSKDLFILCEYDLGDNYFFTMTYKYSPKSNDNDSTVVKLYDRDGRELEIDRLIFYGENSEVLYNYNKNNDIENDFSNQIPPSTKLIRIVKAKHNCMCEYNDGFGDVNFYIAPNILKPSYWIKNIDSLYFIPLDVEKGDTANYLFLPRVK